MAALVLGFLVVLGCVNALKVTGSGEITRAIAGVEFGAHRLIIDAAVDVKRERDVLNVGPFCGGNLSVYGLSECLRVITGNKQHVLSAPVSIGRIGRFIRQRSQFHNDAKPIWSRRLTVPIPNNQQANQWTIRSEILNFGLFDDDPSALSQVQRQLRVVEHRSIDFGCFLSVFCGGFVRFPGQPERTTCQSALGSELTTRDHRERNGRAEYEERQPDQPPIGRRALVIALLLIGFAACYERGGNAYLHGRYRAGDSLFRVALCCFVLALGLCCSIGIPSTWGWWL